jgi:crossover junction endodeoxyribonuclease RusA
VSGAVTFSVRGTPAPQGSKKAIPLAKKVGGRTVFTGKVSLVESSAKVAPWRDAVTREARRHFKVPHDGPVEVALKFFLERPAGHFRTGRNTHLLKAAAPEWPGVKPDVDKLIRSTLDALTTARAYTDDAAVVRVTASKHYATSYYPPGAYITVTPATSREGIAP